MLLIAIGNGVLREAFLKKYTGNFAAHQLSTLSLILFFAAYIAWAMKRFAPASSTQALAVGLLWLLLTLAFEFGFGRWQGQSWTTLLADYNLLKGRLWILVPLWVGFAPFLFYRLSH